MNPKLPEFGYKTTHQLHGICLSVEPVFNPGQNLAGCVEFMIPFL